MIVNIVKQEIETFLNLNLRTISLCIFKSIMSKFSLHHFEQNGSFTIQLLQKLLCLGSRRNLYTCFYLKYISNKIQQLSTQFKTKTRRNLKEKPYIFLILSFFLNELVSVS